MHSSAHVGFSPIATSTDELKSFSAPMLRASKTPFPRVALSTSVETKHAFSAFAQPVTHPDLGLTKIYGLLTKKASHLSPRPLPIHPNTDSAPTSHPTPRNFQTLSRRLTTTNLLQTPSKISLQKALSTKQLISLSPRKTLISSLNLAGFPRLLPFLSSIEPSLGYRRDLPLYMHPPSGTQFGPLTPTMYHYKSSTPSSSSTSLPLYSMTHDTSQTELLKAPPTGPSSAHGYDKPRLGYGFLLSMT